MGLAASLIRGEAERRAARAAARRGAADTKEKGAGGDEQPSMRAANGPLGLHGRLAHGSFRAVCVATSTR